MLCESCRRNPATFKVTFENALGLPCTTYEACEDCVPEYSETVSVQVIVGRRYLTIVR